MKKQKHINEQHRAILIDWLIEEHKGFCLKNKKLYQSFQTNNNLNISANKINNNIFRESNDGTFIINKNNYSMKIRKLILSKSIKKPEKLNISTYNYINKKLY